jgi:hypothetical protein
MHISGVTPVPKLMCTYTEQLCARLQRPSFGHENQRFHENKPKTLIFIPRDKLWWSFSNIGLRRSKEEPPYFLALFFSKNRSSQD